MPSGYRSVGWSSVYIGLGSVWWGASIGCGSICCLRGPSSGRGHGTRELLRWVSVSRSRLRARGARASQLW